MTDPKEELEQFARGISGEAHLERISGRTAWEDRWVAPFSYYGSTGVVRGKVTRRKERRLRVKRNAYRRNLSLWKMRNSAVYLMIKRHHDANREPAVFMEAARLGLPQKTAVFHAED